MEHVAALMLLVGCSSDASVCTQIAVPQPIYRSVAECESAMPLAQRFSATYDRKVVGTCTGLSAAELESSPSVEWAVSRSGRLSVMLTDPPALLASR
ncbi:hypothetical protein [Aureimonas sp. ME7]|uniref:hypothetical protein n=1 Tax=Aureimonas sp. ME7 TaxID=2744252 RepID=UPI0015F3F58A|nr:hypothetical protein [Aureimonas sp. ME7]